jgi:hypothetical protein
VPGDTPVIPDSSPDEEQPTQAPQLIPDTSTCSKDTSQSADGLDPIGLDQDEVAMAAPIATTPEDLVPTSPGHVGIVVDGGTHLQAELSQLKMPELRKRAKDEGIAEDLIEVRILLAIVHEVFSRPLSHAHSRICAFTLATVAQCCSSYMVGSSRSRRAERGRRRANHQCTAGKASHQIARDCRRC